MSVSIRPAYRSGRAPAAPPAALAPLALAAALLIASTCAAYRLSVGEFWNRNPAAALTTPAVAAPAAKSASAVAIPVADQQQQRAKMVRASHAVRDASTPRS